MDAETQIVLEKQNPWWFNKHLDIGIARLNYYPDLKKYLKTQEIMLILGTRRSGKSTLLYQLIDFLKTSPKQILFINLDEPLFQSKADNPTFLNKIIDDYINQNKESNQFYIFIDEVQNYEYWIQTIKTFYDINKNIKFILTGSTSALLKNTASTRLSGRYFTSTIFPLSFKEFLDFKNLNNLSLIQKQHAVNQYLQYGGFPRVVLEKDEILKQDILKNYFQTIYLKDIIFTNKIRNNKEVFDLLYYVLSNIGVPFSYKNIAKILDISPDTVIEYLSYAEQAYLIFQISKYDSSVKKQLLNHKKIYCIDTGLVNSVSFKFSENRGRLLENLVFASLIANKKEVFYHKENNECDFLIRDGRKIIQAIQVTTLLKEESVKKREINGLLEALHKYNLKNGYIVTEVETDIIEIEGKKIFIIPIYDWLENKQ